MSQVFHQSGVNISAVNCQTSEDHRAINQFMILVSDLDQLQKVTKAILKIKGVSDVERITR